ncbi:MAG: putative amidophosphoribosyltransferase [Paracoccaceae bacterium]|jgi:predicted amidophosphoribosyltransferase
MGAMQRLMHLVYPPQCASCGDIVGSEGGLCGPCWRETPFITGLVCDACGVPLPGDDTGVADPAPHCDACLSVGRPWTRGRAVMLYKDNGRRIVLALKHGDRTDTVPAAAAWMARAARPLVKQEMMIAPVPLHWSRLVKRRYNQAALLAQALAGELSLSYCPDLLLRQRATDSMEGKGHDARFANVAQAIVAHPGRKHLLSGRRVMLVDDVMTSGATLGSASEACLAAGASEVCVLALARVAKDA